MKSTAARIGIVALIGGLFGSLGPSGVSARPVLDQCAFNDDCESPLVCAGRRCRAQCRTARDCGIGEQCVDQGVTRVCAVPPSPPMPGELYGRVQTARGAAVRDCRVEVVNVASASCDGRGEFRLVGLAPGGYELRVDVANERLLPRTITAWVDPGDRECVGAVTLALRADPTAADDTIDPATIGGAPAHDSGKKGGDKGSGK
jgi:hypothetical protein